MNQSKEKRSFTRGMSELHTWGGLVFGWLLFVIFFTGTIAVFEQELTHWMQPNVKISVVEPIQALPSAEKKLFAIEYWLCFVKSKLIKNTQNTLFCVFFITHF